MPVTQISTEFDMNIIFLKHRLVGAFVEMQMERYSFMKTL